MLSNYSYTRIIGVATKQQPAALVKVFTCSIRNEHLFKPLDEYKKLKIWKYLSEFTLSLLMVGSIRPPSVCRFDLYFKSWSSH